MRRLDLPHPSMLRRLPKTPGEFRRAGRVIEENELVRDFLIRAGLADQVAWILYPPRNGAPKSADD
jgi:hypothetical protein